MNTSKDLIRNNVNSRDENLHSISDALKKNHHPFLKKITMDYLGTLMSLYDSHSDTYGTPFLPLEVNMRCEGNVLTAYMLCSCIRNIKLPHLRREAILLLKSCSLYIDDEDRLQRVLPYVVALLFDPAAIVQWAAMEILCDILPLVRDFPPSDAKIFPEYIFLMLSMFPCKTSKAKCACEGSKAGKRKYPELTKYDSSYAQILPIDEIKLWHKSINKDMKEIADKTRKIRLSLTRHTCNPVNSRVVWKEENNRSYNFV